MPTEKTDTFELGDYLRPIKSRWYLLILIALVAGAGTYKYYSGKPKSYVSSTTLLLQNGSAVDAAAGGGGFGGEPDRIARTQAVLIRTSGVAERAAKELKFNGDPRVLLSTVTATAAEGTDFLELSATAGNPLVSAQIANAFAHAYISTRQESARKTAQGALNAAQKRLDKLPLKDATLADQRSALVDQIQRLQLYVSTPSASARQLDPAGPGAARFTDPKRAAMFAGLLGLLLGGVVAFGLDALDRRIKRVDDLSELYGHPVLVGVPRARKALRDTTPTNGLQEPLTESFRALRTTLQMTATRAPNGDGFGRDLQTILVTSAMPTEGKSTVVRNLALAYLEAGLRVAIVDADLRNPGLSRSFAISSSPGLTDVLTGAVPLDETLRTIEIDNVKELKELVLARHDISAEEFVVEPDGTTTLKLASPEKESKLPKLSILPAVRAPTDPAAMLTAGRLSAVLDKLSEDHDVVIVDSSPLLAVSDAAALVNMVDGVLLVSRMNLTTAKAADQVRQLVGRIPEAHVMGIVANDVRERAGTYAYSYGGY